MPLAERFHLTRVHANDAGDTYLVDFDESQWQEIVREEFYKGETNTYDFSICLLQRIEGATH